MLPYGQTCRNGEGESIINGRNVRTVAEEHYSSAYALFTQLEHWDEVIRLQLEKAGIYEFQLKSTEKCEIFGRHLN